MQSDNSRLRLSAQRALLGAISPNMRLIKVRMTGEDIAFTAVVESPLSETEREALSVAVAEIVSDFPECNVIEQIVVDRRPIAPENVVAAGWVYMRAE